MLDGPVAPRKLPPQNWELMQLVTSRFERAARAQDTWAKSAKECFDFVEDKQWAAEDLQRVLDADRPALTLNKIKPLIMLVVGFHLQNRTDIKFLPAYDDSGSYDVAQVLSQISKQIGNRSKIQFIDSEVFMDGLIGGRGFYSSRLDFANNDLGEVKHTALDPFSVFLDPDGQEYDLNESCEHVSESRWMSLNQVKLFYGDEAYTLVRPWLSGPGNSGMPSNVMDYGPEIAPWRRFGGENENPEGYYADIMERFFDYFDQERKLVRVIDQQHYMTVPQRFFVDLETGERERVPDFYTPDKIKKVLEFGEYMGNPIRVENRLGRRIRNTQIVGDIIVYDAWSPYDTFTVTPFFPYFRRGTTKGMVESLIDPQREINARRSARLNLVLRAANGGWMYEKDTLDVQARENLERYGSTAGVHIAWDSKGGKLSQPKQIEPPGTPVAMRDLEHEAEEDLKDISGVNEASLGQIQNVQSGRAIEAKQKQTVIGLELYINNYKRSKTLLGEKELELIQSFYTEARILRITGDNGKPIDVPINQKKAMANGAAAATIVNDVTYGKYQAVVDDTPMSATFLEAQFAELLMLKEKGLPIPDDVLLEASSVGNKDQIKIRIAAARAQMGLPPDMPSPDPNAPPPAPMAGPPGAPPAIAGPAPAGPPMAPPAAAAAPPGAVL